MPTHTAHTHTLAHTDTHSHTPGVYLDHRPVDDLGAGRVHDATARVVDVVGAHQGALFKAQDSFEVGVRRLLQAWSEFLQEKKPFSPRHKKQTNTIK